jgi:hypothetical protein
MTVESFAVKITLRTERIPVSAKRCWVRSQARSTPTTAFDRILRNLRYNKLLLQMDRVIVGERPTNDKNANHCPPRQG